MDAPLTRIGEAHVELGGTQRHVEVYTDRLGERMVFVDPKTKLAYGPSEDGEGPLTFLGAWDVSQRMLRRSSGSAGAAGVVADPVSSASSSSSPPYDADDDDDASVDSGSAHESEGARDSESDSRQRSAAVPTKSAKSDQLAAKVAKKRAVSSEVLEHATLSDRLNPSHPAFDAELKARWRTMPKAEREAIVAADRARLQARREAVAAIQHPFETNDDDHCETSLEAYSDLAPLLEHLALLMGKSKADLAIYDPYFCTGSVVGHLGRLGFQNVYNRCEDFYAVAAAGQTPAHDVLVTNPAYSGDHIPRLLEFLAGNGRPFCLLMPSYVLQKDYYRAAQEQHACMRQLMFLYPRRRYVYWAPKGLRRKTQSHASVLGSRTSPFASFWYIWLGPYQERVAKYWRQQIEPKCMCGLARTVARLPPALSGLEGDAAAAQRQRERERERGGPRARRAERPRDEHRSDRRRSGRTHRSERDGAEAQTRPPPDDGAGDPSGMTAAAVDGADVAAASPRASSPRFDRSAKEEKKKEKKEKKKEKKEKHDKRHKHRLDEADASAADDAVGEKRKHSRGHRNDGRAHKRVHTSDAE